MIVTDNLFGDILTDLAAAVTGGIGLAASGNINPTGDVPLDVRAGARLRAGHRGHRQGRPDRDVLSVALLLRHLGYEAEAARIEEAVAADLAERDGTGAHARTRSATRSPHE